MAIDNQELALEIDKAKVDMTLDIQEAQRNVNDSIMDIANRGTDRE